MGQQQLGKYLIKRSAVFVLSLSASIAWGDELLPKPDGQPQRPAVVTVPAPPSLPSEAPALPTQPATGDAAQAAAEIPVQSAQPRVVIGESRVELYDPQTGGILSEIPLPERCLAVVQKGDLLYVAHALTISIVNIRTLETHQEAPPFADQPPDLPSHLRSKRVTNGLSAIYDVTDPWSPQFLRFDAVGFSFQSVLAPSPMFQSNLAPSPIRTLTPQRRRGQGLIAAGSTLLGVWLPSAIVGTAFLAAGHAQPSKSADSREVAGVSNITGIILIPAATFVFGIPAAIMLGVGAYQRKHPLPPPSLADATTLLKAANRALPHDRNAMIVGASLLLTGIAFDLSFLCAQSPLYVSYNSQYRAECDGLIRPSIILGPLLTIAGGLILPIAGGFYAKHQRIIDQYGPKLNRPPAQAPPELSVTPYVSTNDFGLMATGRF